MSANTYDKGDVVRITVAITNAAGAAVDPAALVFSYRTGAGDTATLTYGVDAAVVKDSVGNYHVDLALAWNDAMVYYRWVATGANAGAAEGELRVLRSKVDLT